MINWWINVAVHNHRTFNFIFAKWTTKNFDKRLAGDIPHSISSSTQPPRVLPSPGSRSKLLWFCLMKNYNFAIGTDRRLEREPQTASGIFTSFFRIWDKVNSTVIVLKIVFNLFVAFVRLFQCCQGCIVLRIDPHWVSSSQQCDCELH